MIGSETSTACLNEWGPRGFPLSGNMIVVPEVIDSTLPNLVERPKSVLQHLEKTVQAGMTLTRAPHPLLRVKFRASFNILTVFEPTLLNGGTKVRPEPLDHVRLRSRKHRSQMASYSLRLKDSGMLWVFKDEAHMTECERRSHNLFVYWILALGSLPIIGLLAYAAL